MSKKKKSETKNRAVNCPENRATNCPKNQSQDQAADHGSSDCLKKNSCPGMGTE